MASKWFLFIFLTIFVRTKETQCLNSNESWIRAGYYSVPVELPISEINSALFTHLIFGFVYVNSSSYSISVNSSDSLKSISSFTDVVKRKNPSLKTVLSIRVGGDESRIVLSKLSQSSYRKAFIESSIETARRYRFEGLDMYGLEPKTSTCMENLETLLADWRAAIDSEAKNTNQPRLLLVIMVSHLPSFGEFRYPIETMKKKLDWLHIKSYDYYMPTTTDIAYPQAALFDPSNKFTSTDNGIQEWLKLGFPSNKLVIGLPYFGFGWTLVDTSANPIGSLTSGLAVTLDGSMFYKFLRWHITSNAYGVRSTYNETYVINCCIVGRTWINYDDVEAIKAKVSYAKKMGLLGYFAFQVGFDDNWTLSRAAHGEDEERERYKLRLLATSLSTITISFLLLGAILFVTKKRILGSNGIIGKIYRRLLYKQRIRSISEDVYGNGVTMQVLSYSVIEVATDNFSTENKLGEGGFGPVYKGTLDDGHEFAVKRLSTTSNQGVEEFKNEVLLTANLQHVNLLRVLGYCTEKQEKMLIYEYMSNKSLNFYLFDATRKHLLNWNTRVRIIEGITQGLLYLQEYSNSIIIHRDLKASNILLDHEMNPRISDFGIARAFSKGEDEANTDRIVGTYGYVPPEYVNKGIYSMKSDVYSFGVLLLQIISGKRNTCQYGTNENLNLMEYAYELWNADQGLMFIDSILDDSSSTCKALRCMQVALLCVQENRVDRPSMLKVSWMLKSEAGPIVAPMKPAFSVNVDFGPSLRQETFSVDDSTISQVVPR